MKLETFFKHFDLLAEAPNGVQKLRELILDLAVRGKLVPQDANDEPAAVLLEKIKKEKERLVKEGKVKKDKLSQSIIAEEIPYKLPTNWQWTKLCEIGLINPRNEVDDSKIASFIPMNLIPQSYNKEIRYEVRKWADIKKGFTHFADGDVVLAKITPCFQNRKSTVIYGLKNSVGAGTTELHVYRPINNLINPEYVLLYLKSAEFINNGISKLTGTAGQKRVPNEYFAENPFPLPPLAEQKRIVTKVDELMKLCDELEARQKKKQETRILINNAALNKLLTADTPETFTKNWQRIGDNFDLLYSAPENIGKLRQAILQLAVMGKLVPQNANDEPAAVLLERIKKEKERLVKEGKVKKEKSLPEIKDNDIPFDLPIGWEWVRLGELAKVIEYGTSEKSSELRDDVPVFRMNNVQEGKIIFENLKYVSATIKDLPRLYLQHGDLLFNRTNSYELVGKTGVFKGISNQYTFASYLIKISLMLEYISPDFINTAINSAYFRQTQINPEITQQCGQANFNGTKLKNTLIPLPPLAEQKRIVTKVDKLMKLCDELETKLTQTQTESEKIINAAVKQLLTV
ncbi:MAG: restriction endonuclease subunit S [Dolichospermum sp. DET73]|nr:restriction endonuclease subunit S [Dolichospermum sp. DET73]